MMDQPHIADKYREAWLEQNKKDMIKNPRLLSNSSSVSAFKRHQVQKIEANKRPMNEKAKVVNRLIKKKMTHSEISEILSITNKTVSEIKRRYDLPRDEI